LEPVYHASATSWSAKRMLPVQGTLRAPHPASAEMGWRARRHLL
jgi:hypothetical protein